MMLSLFCMLYWLGVKGLMQILILRNYSICYTPPFDRFHLSLPRKGAKVFFKYRCSDKLFGSTYDDLG